MALTSDTPTDAAATRGRSSTDEAARDAGIVVVSHAPLFYWWPVWLASLVLGAWSSLRGEPVMLNDAGAERLIPASGPGLTFVTILLLVILFTTVTLRGLASITALLCVALVGVTLAYFGLWDDIARSIPDLSVHMNSGFYWTFGAALLVLWTLQFFVFDRLVVYRFRPGQLVEERLIGGGERTHDTTGMVVERRNDDFLRHRVLGLGAGDLVIHTRDAQGGPIRVTNVPWVERRVGAIQALVNVKPDEVRGAAG